MTAEQSYPLAAGQRRRLSLPWAVLLVFLVIMVTTGGNDPRIFDLTKSAAESAAENASAGAQSPLTAATVGQSVRDGRFAFMVTSRQPPSVTLTNRLGNAVTAVGRFVTVRVNVSNLGPEARALNATGQFLIGSTGRRFATSSAVSFVGGAETIFATKINPGQTVYDAPLLFDVPVGTTIAGIELHGLPSSTGVTVKLS